ncbi:MAG TPA: formate dehydrogenase accessory sulfurtransferase FdhD [Myxococcota bacterium]|nr:formate dehydrogenase accessory sulfurtransferase FdhD [Myxococcota bacterium]
MATSPGKLTVDALALRGGALRPRSDALVVEEPLEIRLDGEPLAVTMRTPGHDVELAAGFLVTEGVARDFAAVTSIAHCDAEGNTVLVRSEPGSPWIVPPPPRAFAATAACGLCGKATLESLRTRAPALHGDPARVEAAVLRALPERLRAAQPLFRDTGALHAAGLFTQDGELLCAREDVGRHNAVDKVVGWAALEGRLPLAGSILLVSGRIGFEIAQKALVAGIPILAAISGASSLAVELARENGQALVAFLRGEALTVYAGSERIRLP